VIGAERQSIITTVSTLTIKIGDAVMGAAHGLLPLLLSRIVSFLILHKLFGTVCLPWLSKIKHLIEHHPEAPIV
jgi:hypothetical protein